MSLSVAWRIACKDTRLFQTFSCSWTPPRRSTHCSELSEGGWDSSAAWRLARTSRSSSNRFASVGGSSQISVSRPTRSAARARI